MITKERLEELIKQKRSVYCKTYDGHIRCVQLDSSFINNHDMLYFYENKEDLE